MGAGQEPGQLSPTPTWPSQQLSERNALSSRLTPWFSRWVWLDKAQASLPGHVHDHDGVIQHIH